MYVCYWLKILNKKAYTYIYAFFIHTYYILAGSVHILLQSIPTVKFPLFITNDYILRADVEYETRLTTFYLKWFRLAHFESYKDSEFSNVLRLLKFNINMGVQIKRHIVLVMMCKYFEFIIFKKKVSDNSLTCEQNYVVFFHHN